MKLSAVIALPCTVGLFFMAEPIMKLIFFDKYEGILILKYLSLSIPFVIVTQITTSILQATNHYIRPVINLIVGCIVKVILTWILVPISEINIYGAVIASICAYMVVTILNIISLKKKTKMNINLYDSFISPMYASMAMALAVIYSYNKIMLKINSNSISCLISIFMGIIIYGIAILVLRVFEVDDIKKRIVRN